MRDRIVKALRALPARVGESETALHGRISAALSAAGAYPRHETDLGRGIGRVDFFCTGGVAVEAKIGYGSRDRLASQVARYLGHPAVYALVVVTERRAPTWLAEALARVSKAAGKPVEIVELARGVAS